MKKNRLIIALICIIIISCKPVKDISDNSKTAKINTEQIINNHNTKKSVFKTLKSTLKITIKSVKKDENYIANIRILKDKKIWISAGKFGITGAKLLITQNKVQYYNKIDEEYFNGDFSLLSNWLGTKLNFQQIQSLLLGEAIYPLETDKYTSEILTNSYLLTPIRQEKLLEHFITLNANNFKVKSQEIAKPKELRIFNIDYISYQEIDNQLLPLLMNLSLVNKNTETQIELISKNTSLNQELRYPFKTPTNYKEISFEK